ncbi:MAG: hypothetical protein K6T81_16690 [Alicyclobacillus macrosporangiidus]|jgi:hypothetical protein|uniref:Uncharacterized protein n=1 Tax=Alicyclobacillus macrosporangiidus TaxID=392015 RepID=A0A1I7FVH7_9BACL|nr:hypothetical protein [Alicyclobacillus macrosporangiidus]MCL6600350.1 hypothetical protein [Alicyclobacillus macrosporangiidus]SFU40189.1 hypothetical protein SAMN05421543_101473 [Alicyclobacillus macrosporangiidus]
MMHERWPKGMTPPTPETPESVSRPVTLADFNYVGEIQRAITSLPFGIRVVACHVEEHDGEPPRVSLALEITERREAK